MRPAEIKPLTAIRGIAALWVIFHHFTIFFVYPNFNPCTKILFLGFTGVDIFFTLSGFILATVYHNLSLRAVPDFALRRVLRIYPLHLVILGVMAGCAYCHFIWPSAPPYWHNVPAVALLLQPYVNVYPWVWNAATWSAGVEISFYLLFPWAVMLLRRFPAALVALLVLAAAYCEWHVQTIDMGRFIGLRSLMRGNADAMLGLVLGLLAVKYRLPRYAACAGEIAAAATIAWACASFNVQLVVLAAAGLIWMLDHEAGPIAWALSTSVPLFLGRVSYSLYLLHLPLNAVFSFVWRVHGHPSLNAGFILRETIFFAVLFSLSAATCHFIERPARDLWRGKRKPARPATPVLA